MVELFYRALFFCTIIAFLTWSPVALIVLTLAKI